MPARAELEKKSILWYPVRAVGVCEYTVSILNTLHVERSHSVIIVQYIYYRQILPFFLQTFSNICLYYFVKKKLEE